MTLFTCRPAYTGVPFFIPQTTTLRYMLDPAEKALVFQVLEQSPDITAFLSKYTFMASNGLKVASDKYPEFKHSKNTIFLRGTDTSENFKLDTTRFVGNMQRNNAAEMVHTALAEFHKAVKNSTYGRTYGANPFYTTPKGAGNKASAAKIVVVNLNG